MQGTRKLLVKFSFALVAASVLVGQRMQTLLGWYDSQLQSQQQQYEEIVAQSRQWRQPGEFE